ncbi:hypothetical protein KKE34_04815 [Patescibacteria group bacterium]|nr:hypothetical protein [Patescibacteria group bacterium]MBU1885895.1 hypothetical protein [Patescibacteria group bacterium]
MSIETNDVVPSKNYKDDEIGINYAPTPTPEQQGADEALAIFASILAISVPIVLGLSSN